MKDLQGILLECVSISPGDEGIRFMLYESIADCSGRDQCCVLREFEKASLASV